MILAISDFCSNIVGGFGKSWTGVGWTIWLAWLLTPYVVPLNMMMIVWICSTVLLVFWWICDAMDQQVAWWQALVGIAMLVVSFLPRGGLFAIATWIIYWTKVRE